MLTALDAEIVRELLESRTWQSLGEQVGQHRRSAAVLDFDFTGLHFVTNVMVFDVDVLGTPMIHGVLGHLDA